MDHLYHPFKGFRGTVGLTALLLGATALAGGAFAASSAENPKTNSLSVTETSFGTMPDGQKVEMYRLKNAKGMEVDMITYGARVQAIKVPDKNGKIDDVALGFDSMKGYLGPDDPYFGATIGRYANRIAKGTFALDGKTYHLPVNNGPNSLHGGTTGFDKKVWAASEIKTPSSVGVEFTLFSPNGDNGYPGDLAVNVRYTLDNRNDLLIHYSAVDDQPTVINLTNHTYFNLAGAGDGTVLDQVAMINANKVTEMDNTEIPTGKIVDVAGTPLSFITPTAIGANIHADNQQLKFAEPKEGGYDFNYVLNNPDDLNALAASVTDPKSGRTIEMYTDQPGVQFYTSNFLHHVTGKDGKIYQHWGAFTLEAQHFPDSPNQPSFPSTVLKPGDKYSQTTMYKFLPTNLPS